MAKAFLGLGGNIGDAKQILKDAIVCLAQHPQIEITARSCFYKTEPINAPGDDYINCVIALETKLGPLPLLRHCQSVEAKFGRERPFENAPRTLDIDVLLYNDAIENHPDLILPHPRMTERLFVIIPLLEVAPNIEIPGFGPIKHLTETLASQRINRVEGCQCPQLSGF